MKKRIGIFICFIMAFFIGTTAVSMTFPSFINAAGDDTYDGEKIIDFTTFLPWNNVVNASNYGAGSAYLITEDHNVLYMEKVVDPGKGNNKVELVVDKNGKALENVVSISGNSDGSREHPGGIALRKDGWLYVWGNNEYGQFGNGETSNEYFSNAILFDPQVSNIKSVFSTATTNYLLTENGDVYASGMNEHGELGNGTVDPSTNHRFTKVENLSNVKKLTGTESGDMGVYALTNNGEAYGWGKQINDGTRELYNIATPTQICKKDGTPLTNIVDIDGKEWFGYKDNNQSYCKGLSRVHFLTFDGEKSTDYIFMTEITGTSQLEEYVTFDGAADFFESSGVYSIGRTGYFLKDNKVYFSDGKTAFWEEPKFYKSIAAPYVMKKIGETGTVRITLLEDGRMAFEGVAFPLQLPLKVTGQKVSDNSTYGSGDFYHDDVKINAIVPTDKTVTCQVQNPLGSPAIECTDFNDGKIEISVNDNERIYRKYIFESQGITQEFIIDLYKGTPTLTGYTSTSTNKIKVTDTISLVVPTDQSGWNSYTAKIKDASGNTTDYTGGTLSEGTYTLTVTDKYGNTQNYTFEVTDKPKPTAVFTPNSTSFVYKDTYTVVNGTIGTLALTYPDGEPTSNIASISLSGTDASKFSIDNTGALKVKGSNLNVGTYNITISGKDGNDMAFSKDVSVVVGKANQDNYKITNSANYPFVANQKITITTSGKESTGSETFTITSGNAASISGNQFQILSSGTFTLEATVSGDANYNSKTVSQTITISELPVQPNPIQITSADSMMYGDTYTPSYSGGSGSGKVSWSIENDSGCGATLSNGSIKVTGVGTFTLKVTKEGDTSYQSSSDTKVISVNRRKTTVKPNDVTKKVGEAFQGKGVTLTPQPLSGDVIGTAIVTSKYPITQQAGRYTDGIQASGLSNPNYEFEYVDGTLIINDTTLPNNGSGYYKVDGTKGKNNWYVSDIQISTTNQNGYDEISADGVTFGTAPLTYQSDGSYPVTFYLKNSTTGLIAKGITYQVKAV